MSTYQYMSIPFTGSTKASDKTPGKTLANQLQQVINEFANQGWEFYSLDAVHVSVAPGCLASLLGAKAILVEYDVVIFRRIVAT